VGPGAALDEDDEPAAKCLRERSVSRGRSAGRAGGSTSRGRGVVRGRSTSVSSRAASRTTGVDECVGGEGVEQVLKEKPKNDDVIKAKKGQRGRSKTSDEVVEVVAPGMEETSDKKKPKRKRDLDEMEEIDEAVAHKKAKSKRMKTQEEKKKEKSKGKQAGVTEKTPLAALYGVSNSFPLTHI
jgi:hypothetical protein